jgi:hypothetical protein
MQPPIAMTHHRGNTIGPQCSADLRPAVVPEWLQSSHFLGHSTSVLGYTLSIGVCLSVYVANPVSGMFG